MIAFDASPRYRLHISKEVDPYPRLAVRLCNLKASASHLIRLAAPVQVPCHVPRHKLAVNVLLPEAVDPHETIDWHSREWAR